MITALQIIFWISVFLVVYTYVGYGFILFLMVKIKRLFGKSDVIPETPNEFPEVTFVVAAYNEQDWIVEKINNTLELEYPKDKIKYFFVTDGSNDRTPEIIQQYPQIKLFHRPERAGKIAAVERIMEFVETPIVIYTDANTMVNKEAIYNIVRHYEDPKVGVVAGEKRITMLSEDAANAAGEGIIGNTNRP